MNQQLNIFTVVLHVILSSYQYNYRPKWFDKLAGLFQIYAHFC